MRRTTVLMAIMFLGIGYTGATAQPVGGGGGGFGGGNARVMMGAGNLTQYRQQTLDAIKEQLAVSDEEWEKLSPKIEKVMDAKRNLSTGAGIGWSSTNGAAPVMHISAGKLDTPVGIAMQDLRAAVEDKDTPADQITAKLEALKDAIQKAHAEYDAAKKELQAALTPRQQAVLATMGIVE